MIFFDLLTPGTELTLHHEAFLETSELIQAFCLEVNEAYKISYCNDICELLQRYLIRHDLTYLMQMFDIFE